ncbi:hypothetical protein BB559_003615 [Furculomyces boomerangus]|uniref:Inositol polyphosphate-related phosphatase domain-containing protein n=1 Tax=Furculomyces boomerangus TaxID=61424 RepID=A0A2T9YKA3_9FUNG|nr:hypothetical protein BB559_003615 [Furculomyces boomerangus]
MLLDSEEWKNKIYPILKSTDECWHILDELHEERAYFAFVRKKNSVSNSVCLMIFWKFSKKTISVKDMINLSSSLTFSNEPDRREERVVIVEENPRELVILKNSEKEINLAFDSLMDTNEFIIAVDSYRIKSDNFTKTNTSSLQTENPEQVWLESFFFDWTNYYDPDPSGKLDDDEYETLRRSTELEEFRREKWISERLHMREHEFAELRDISILIGTWNVNGQNPPDSVFQELDLSAGSFVYYDNTKEKEWSTCIEAALSECTDQYIKFSSKQLVGMLILGYCRYDVLPRIKSFLCSSLGVGILGMIGNKGAVGIRMVIDDTPISFINSHLAHADAMAERRNVQFHEICRRMEFEIPSNVNTVDPNDRKRLSLGYVYDFSTESCENLGIFDSSIVFWFGDLNYRLDSNYEMTNSLINTKQTHLLKGFDQLYSSMRRGLAFDEFREADFDFPPTYKFEIGTENYTDKRNPAWCDRVLWWINKDYNVNHVRNLGYESVSEITTSDHKPVWSIFKLKTKLINKSKYEKSIAKILRELDMVENELIPSATVVPQVIDFGTVNFGIKYKKSLVLKNNGQPGDESIGPKWLWVNKIKGVLLPGNVMDIDFICYITGDSVGEINTQLARSYSDKLQINSSNEETPEKAEKQSLEVYRCLNSEYKIDEIVLLKIVGGKDFFIQIGGNYKISSIGLDPSLKLEPFCNKEKTPNTDQDNLQLSKNIDSISVKDIPPALNSILQSLNNYIELKETWFVKTPSDFLVKVVRELVDSNSLNALQDKQFVTETLKAYLKRNLENTNNNKLCNKPNPILDNDGSSEMGKNDKENSETSTNSEYHKSIENKEDFTFNTKDEQCTSDVDICNAILSNLVTYLASLPEPIIPNNMPAPFVKAINTGDDKKIQKAIEFMDPHIRSIFMEIIQYFSSLAQGENPKKEENTHTSSLLERYKNILCFTFMLLQSIHYPKPIQQDYSYLNSKISEDKNTSFETISDNDQQQMSQLAYDFTEMIYNKNSF